LRRLALALFLFALAVRPAVALDRLAFTFTRYDLQVMLDPHQHGLAVEGTVELRNASKVSQSSASLQLSSSLRWLSILANGAEVEWLEQSYTSDIDHTGVLTEAIVKFDAPIPPGETVRLNLRYSGTVTKDTTRLQRIGTPAEVARRSDWDEISDSFTALRGAGFVVWYPVAMDAVNLAAGNELFEALRNWRERQASSLLRVHLSRAALPEGDASKFSFVTNGSATATGTAITEEFPGTDPVVVLLNDPASTTDRPRVAAYYTAAHTGFARDYMAAAESVIPPLEEWFGTPHTKVVLVELADPNALPYDVGTYYFVPMRSVLPAAAEVAMTRPVVHAMLESPRPWIREGLAGFAQALVRERQAGHRAALAYLGQFGSALAVAEVQSHSAMPGVTQGIKSGVAQDVAPGVSSATAAPSSASNLQPLITTADQMFLHTKSTYVWWMLRDIVGDRVLQSALAKYRAADDRDSAYMQRLIEKQDPAHRDLEPFFDDWVYRDRGLPQLRVNSAYVRQTLGEKTVTAVTIENLGEAWCEVPVTVSSAGGETQARVVVPAKGKAIVRVPFESAPSHAEVNDGSVPESEPRDNQVPVTTTPPSSEAAPHLP
jgi:hypothetical protein